MNKKKYQVIYADPPWKYANKQHNGKGKKDTGGAHSHYPTMSVGEMVDEFKPMIDEWADTDCLLYMWVSSPVMDEAIVLGQAWGFDYKTVAFVWHKGKPNPGYYTMSETELCLVFKRKGGKIPRNSRCSRNERQFLMEKRREHSRKPNEIRKRIERMHRCHNKLEMFARTASDGWHIFGNQTDKFPADDCKEITQLNLL